jgi:hypothetical protein
VVIAESTRKLLGNLFELGDLGPKELKGIAALGRAWEALRPASVESRFEAMHATGLTVTSRHPNFHRGKFGSAIKTVTGRGQLRTDQIRR